MNGDTLGSLSRTETGVDSANLSADDEERAPSISSLRPVLSFPLDKSDNENDNDNESSTTRRRRPRPRRNPNRGGRGGTRGALSRATTGISRATTTTFSNEDGEPPPLADIRSLLYGQNKPGPCSYCKKNPNTVHWRRPYHEYIRQLTASGWTYLRRLDNFMAFPDHSGKRRLPPEVKARWRSKLSLTVLDYLDGGQIKSETFNNCYSLREFLLMDRPEHVKGRLFLMEDLSREAIEFLGSAFNVEPDFWEGHISGTASLLGGNYVYGPYNTRVKFPSRLLAKSKRSAHFRMDFVKFRTNTEKEDPIAPQAENFNILRYSETIDEPLRKPSYFDDDEVKQQIWTDQRVSVLMLPHGDNQWTGIIVFDPSFEDSRDQSPWKTRSFAKYPSIHSQMEPSYVFSNGRSDYEDFISIQLSKTPAEVEAAIADSYYGIHELFLLIASQWTTCSSSIWVQLATLEQRIQDNVGGEIEAVLSVHVKDLLQWQTMVEAFLLMVNLSIEQLSSGGFRDGWKRFEHTDTNQHLILETEKDIVAEFERLKNEFRAFKERINRNLALFNSSISIEESKKAIKESESVSLLTKLAFVFIPLSFIASLFSIQGNMAPGGNKFWLYWVISIPLTIMTFFAAAIVTWLAKSVGQYFTFAFWLNRKPQRPKPKFQKKTPLKERLMLYLPWRKKPINNFQKAVEEGTLRKTMTGTESTFTRTTTKAESDFNLEMRPVPTFST
jgi:hypothetical protein